MSHLDTVSVPVIIGGQPLAGLVLDFSDILVVDVLATSGTVGSPQTGMTTVAVGDNDSVMSVVSEADDLAAAPFASGISAAAKVVIRKIFSPTNRHPSTVRLLSIDIVGGDSWATIWAAAKLAHPHWYAVVLVNGTDSVIADAVEGIAALPGDHQVFAGLSDIAVAGAASATFASSDLGTLTTAQKRCLFLTYHPGNVPGGTTDADFAEYAGSYLTADFLRGSPGGNRILTNTTAQSPLTSTQRTNLRANNVNFVDSYFTTQTYMDPGDVLDGIGIYNMTTAHLLRNQIRNSLARLKSSFVARDLKIPLSTRGQQLGKQALDAVVDQLREADHLMSAADVAALVGPPQTPPYVKALPITLEDKDAGRMRFEVFQYALQDARSFLVTVYLQA